MAPKSNKNAHQLAPSSGTKSIGKNSYEMQKSSKTITKDTYDGYTTTKKYVETRKGGEFVDGRNGNEGYKEEYKWQTTHRTRNEAEGYTREIQTEVKIKEKTTYHKNYDKHYSYKKLIDGCTSNDNYGNDYYYYDVGHDADYY